MSHILGDIQANSMVSNASDSLAIFHFYHTFKLLLKILLCTCETNEWLEIYLKCKKPVFQFYHYKWRKKNKLSTGFYDFSLLSIIFYSILFLLCQNLLLLIQTIFHLPNGEWNGNMLNFCLLQDFKSYTLNFQIFRLNVFQWGIIPVFPFF